MMKNGVQRFGGTSEKKPNPYANMSRVVSVESPDSRDGLTTPAKTMASIYHSTELGLDEEITHGSPLRVVQSPMDALRLGMASPFRNFLGLLKPPALPESSSHGSSEESPRHSNTSDTEIENLCLGALKLTLSAGGDQKEVGAEMTSSSVATSRLYEARGEGQSLVMVAFDANAKEISHAGIVWAMDNVLKRGDILTVVSVMDSVRGPLGYRVKIGDQKWLSANQKLVEEEIRHKMELWMNFPGLDNRCAEGGVKLVVMVKAAQRGELAICKEAIKLGACHVVLEKSLKNRRREFYLQNLSCDVTRMRRSGGVDVIRPSLDMAMMMGMVQRNTKLATEPPSPTSVIPRPVLSYGDQIDEFEISLGVPKPKRVNFRTPKSSPVAPPVPSPKYSGELRHQSSFASSGELRQPSSSAYSGELQRLSCSAVLSSAHERSNSMSLSTSAHSVQDSVQASMTSSSSATDNGQDDDLFSIFHGSTRHTEVDTDLFSNIGRPSTSGYESDDLFSIGNNSARRSSPAPPLDYHHSHSHTLLRHGQCPIPDTTISRPNHPRHSMDSIATPSSRELVMAEPLREAIITRITFVVGLGEAVTLNLRQPLCPGEGLLVGSSPSALFLMHADHRNDLCIATPASYIAMDGRMAMKLAFLEPDQRVLAVDSLGRTRTIPVGHATTTATPLVLVEAQSEGRRLSAMLHHTESVGLCHSHSHSEPGAMVSVKSLKVGNRVLLRLRSTEPSHAIWS